jgi:hypothetical protein
VGARLAGEADRRLPWLRGWRSGGAQAALIALSAALLALGVWTALNGPVTWQSGGVRLFRNGSVVRPLVLSVLCLGLTGWGRRAGIGFAVAVLLLVLPLDRYFENIRRVTTINHPLRTLRDCAIDVHRTSPQTAAGVLRASGDVLHHSYYYYMRHTGRWVIADPPNDGAALQHALSSHEMMPALVTRTQQKALAQDGRSAVSGVLVEDEVAVLLPGPFEACIPRALAAGARPLPQVDRGPVSASR